MRAVSIISLMMLSAAAFADKVMITGSPVVLEKRGEVYYVPANYAEPTTTYRYVTVDGSNRVCYLDKQPDFATLNAMPVSVNIGGKTVTWTCYEYNPTYFEVTP